jgi:hypothetical protein
MVEGITLFHFLSICYSSLGTAKESLFDIEMVRKNLINVHQWLFDMLDRCSGLQAIVIAVTFWHIWEQEMLSGKIKPGLVPLGQCRKFNPLWI